MTLYWYIYIYHCLTRAIAHSLTLAFSDPPSLSKRQIYQYKQVLKQKQQRIGQKVTVSPNKNNNNNEKGEENVTVLEMGRKMKEEEGDHVDMSGITTMEGSENVMVIRDLDTELDILTTPLELSPQTACTTFLSLSLSLSLSDHPDSPDNPVIIITLITV